MYNRISWEKKKRQKIHLMFQIYRLFELLNANYTITFLSWEGSTLKHQVFHILMKDFNKLPYGVTPGTMV